MQSPVVQRALISVSDKTGLADFARGLAAAGIEIFSTGGTRQFLEGQGLAGPRCFGLYRLSGNDGWPRQDAASQGSRRHSLPPRSSGRHGGAWTARHRAASSWSSVNLYPFESTVARPEVDRRRSDRADRHRWAVADPRGGQEPRLRGRCDQCRTICRGVWPKSRPRRLDHARTATQLGRRGLRSNRAATIRPSPTTSTARMLKAPLPGNCSSHSSGAKCCVTARTRISRRRCTRNPRRRRFPGRRPPGQRQGALL